jgi:5-methylcytosine-specific restriction enzyme A
MILFKNRFDTLAGVLKNAKHACDSRPSDIYPGEIILIAQTMNTLSRGQKSIRYIMEFQSCYEDKLGESDSIWGKEWKYIIKGKNIRQVEPFNLEDIQVTNHNYSPIVTHGKLKTDDEDAVLNWIGNFLEEQSLDIDEIEGSTEEFKIDNDLDSLIDHLDAKYSKNPKYRQIVVRQLQRPSALRNAIILRKGTKCQICGIEGFKMKTGGKYCEVHHMLELNQNAPNSLQSWNLIVVCPTCHRKLHFAHTTSLLKNQVWEITLNDNKYILK